MLGPPLPPPSSHLPLLSSAVLNEPPPSLLLHIHPPSDLAIHPGWLELMWSFKEEFVAHPSKKLQVLYMCIIVWYTAPTVIPIPMCSECSHSQIFKKKKYQLKISLKHPPHLLSSPLPFFWMQPGFPPYLMSPVMYWNVYRAKPPVFLGFQSQFFEAKLVK